MADLDNDGRDELLFTGNEPVLHRIWGDDAGFHEELIISGVMNPIVGETRDGEWWMLGGSGFLDSPLYLFGQDAAVIGPVEFFDAHSIEPQVARDFGVFDKEVVSHTADEAVLLSAYPCD